MSNTQPLPTADGSQHPLAPLLIWAEKEQGKAWDQWSKEAQKKNAPIAQYLGSRRETLSDVIEKIKQEMRAAPRLNATCKKCGHDKPKMQFMLGYAPYTQDHHKCTCKNCGWSWAIPPLHSA
jgi:hypothetical protein